MDDQHNKLMAYVLDEPEKAAREIARLRAGCNCTLEGVAGFLIGVLLVLWFG